MKILALRSWGKMGRIIRNIVIASYVLGGKRGDCMINITQVPLP